MSDGQYKSQSARDAQAHNYGGPSYWAYLDRAAQENRDFYLRHGNPRMAEAMMTRPLSQALQGNDGP